MEMESIKRYQKMACKAIEEIKESDLRRPEGAAMAKNLASFYLKLDEMSDGGMSERSYSRGGMWDARGSYDGDSYRGYSMRRGYSRADSYGGDDVMEQLERMAQESGSPQERSAIERFMREMRNMK